jgi:epoxyqueuosine reductase QueG
MLETTPSIVYATLYQTCNTELDQLAFHLCRILNRRGHPSLFMPRDGYGHISVLVEEPTASFSQVYAAKYGGLGTVGYNHTLLTPQYGPRVRFVSIFTSLKISGSNMLGEELCTQCRMCAQCCPTKAFQMDGKGPVGAMDKKACAIYHTKLKDSYRFPCGVCIKVCPVGKDRKLYESEDVRKYLSLESSEEKQGWLHCQAYGGKALD